MKRPKKMSRGVFESELTLTLASLEMECSNIEDLLDYANEHEKEMALKIRRELSPIANGLLYLVMGMPQEPSPFRRFVDKEDKETKHGK